MTFKKKFDCILPASCCSHHHSATEAMVDRIYLKNAIASRTKVGRHGQQRARHAVRGAVVVHSLARAVQVPVVDDHVAADREAWVE